MKNLLLSWHNFVRFFWRRTTKNRIFISHNSFCKPCGWHAVLKNVFRTKTWYNFLALIANGFWNTARNGTFTHFCKPVCMDTIWPRTLSVSIKYLRTNWLAAIDYIQLWLSMNVGWFNLTRKFSNGHGLCCTLFFQIKVSPLIHSNDKSKIYSKGPTMVIMEQQHWCESLR